MKYFVESFTVVTSIFGVTPEKLDKQLAAELNRLSSKGYDIVSVFELNSGSDNFDFKIVYRLDDGSSSNMLFVGDSVLLVNQKVREEYNIPPETIGKITKIEGSNLTVRFEIKNIIKPVTLDWQMVKKVK